MSETASEQSRPATAGRRTPEQEQAEKGRDVAPADQLALEDINPLNAHLFRENRWQGYFERLRKEDPVHFSELESAGRYWSVTKYDDIKTVSANWETFSSAQGITLGFRAGSEGPTMQLGTRPPFISQDPPGQTEQQRFSEIVILN